MNNRKKIAVAVSGGVDSGTSLFLLKQSGWDTIAVFAEHFECRNTSASASCCSLDSERRARETAVYLNVPFYKMDLKKEFSEKVTNMFIDYYNRGLTPNPCVWCNSRLRFTILMDRLKGMGIEYMATGHYAGIKDGRLVKAADKSKDQSYFLYDIPRERFPDIIFPLAGLNKAQVYDIASKNSLPVRSAEESQDCCILMEENLKSYLNANIKVKEGDIVDIEGNVLGRHPGYQNFTIGQRKGLGGLGRKMYVIDIIPDNNQVVVGDEKNLYRQEICIRIRPDRFFAEKGERLKVKIRYAHQPAECKVVELDINSNICKIKFMEPQRAVTPGQSAVLYREEEILGGGEILK